MLILQKLAYGPSIIIVLYLLLTSSILLIINIKNKNLQNYLLNVYQYRKNITLLKNWVILDEEKNMHKKIVRKYYEKVNKMVYIFSFFFIITITYLLNVLTIIQPLVIIALIVVLIGFLVCLIQVILYRFPIAVTFIIPFISFFIVSFLHDSNTIRNLILLKGLFVLFSAISYVFICLGAQPYVIRNLHKNQLFINGVPNIILLIFTLLMNNIKKPSLDFTKDPNFSKYPNGVQNIFSDKEFANTIRDIIYQYQMTEITSNITTYILIISITIFIFSASLNIKMRCDNKKASKLLSIIRRKSIKHQKFCYRDFQKISYYGGQYYEDQLFSIPGVYKLIYDIEVNKERS